MPAVCTWAYDGGYFPIKLTGHLDMIIVKKPTNCHETCIFLSKL